MIKSAQKLRYLCTYDLNRMYYFEKKKTPKLPKYDDEDTCNSPVEPMSPKRMMKKKLIIKN